MILANYMLEFTDLDEVWFVVSPHNPLKDKQTLLSQTHRLAMVRLAVEDHPHLKASNIEFKLSQPSYTINTLAHLKEKYPKRDFSLIMGMDNLATFDKWKNYEQILKNYNLYIYPRMRLEPSKFADHPKVHLTNAPVIEISSSFIRKAIKEKKNVSCFMPDKVAAYIKEMNFYKK
jgi:nicotinate-nucleotide adenylyltransferase